MESICPVCKKPYDGVVCTQCTVTDLDMGGLMAGEGLQLKSDESQSDANATAYLVDLVSNRKIPITAPRCKVGRDDLNDIVISGDQSISRFHFVITKEGNQYMVQDGKSRHGTFLNGNQITAPEPIHDGDVLKVGVSLFWFVIESAVPAAVPEKFAPVDVGAMEQPEQELEFVLPEPSNQQGTREMHLPDAANVSISPKGETKKKADDQSEITVAMLLDPLQHHELTRPDSDKEQDKPAARDSEKSDADTTHANLAALEAEKAQAADALTSKAEDMSPDAVASESKNFTDFDDKYSEQKSFNEYTYGINDLFDPLRKVANALSAAREENPTDDFSASAAPPPPVVEADRSMMAEETSQDETKLAEKDQQSEPVQEQVKLEATSKSASELSAKESAAKESAAKDSEETEAKEKESAAKAPAVNEPQELITREPVTRESLAEGPHSKETPAEEPVSKGPQLRESLEEAPVAKGMQAKDSRTEEPVDGKAEFDAAAATPSTLDKFAEIIGEVSNNTDTKEEPASSVKLNFQSSSDKVERDEPKREDFTRVGASTTNGESQSSNGAKGMSIVKEAGSSTVPEWCKKYFSSELNSLSKELTELNEQVRLAQQKIKEVEGRVALTKGLRNTLLTAQGEELVEACGKVLTMLGWRVKISEEDKHELRLDTGEDKNVSIARIVWTESQADRTHLGQLSISQTRYWCEQGVEPKGILLVCKSGDTAPAPLTSSDMNSELAEYAAKKNVCLMTTLQLLSVYKEIALHDGSPETVRATILASSGWLAGFNLEPGSESADREEGSGTNKLSSLLSA